MKNEPVAWIIDASMTDCDDNFIWNTGNYPDWQVKDWIPLYTHPVKELTDEEILCLWDWWSGEILSTDILDFADTYKRVLLGEEGLLEWHKEYVKKMNEQYPSGKVTEK
jgi:hypothetical protein